MSAVACVDVNVRAGSASACFSACVGVGCCSRRRLVVGGWLFASASVLVCVGVGCCLICGQLFALCGSLVCRLVCVGASVWFAIRFAFVSSRIDGSVWALVVAWFVFASVDATPSLCFTRHALRWVGCCRRCRVGLLLGLCGCPWFASAASVSVVPWFATVIAICVGGQCGCWFVSVGVWFVLVVRICVGRFLALVVCARLLLASWLLAPSVMVVALCRCVGCRDLCR